MTRNNNSYRFKGRAVFLAAIMVISMLAMPVAFTGVAAADLGAGDASVSNESVADIEDGAGASAEKQEVSFNVSDVSSSSDGTITIDYSNVSDADGEVIGATGQINDSDNIDSFDVDFDDDEVTVDIEGGDDTDHKVTLQVIHDLSDVEPVHNVEIAFLNESDAVTGTDDFNVSARDVDDRNRAYEGQYVQSTNATGIDDVELIRDPGDDNEFIDVESPEDGLVFFDTDGLETGEDYAFVDEDTGDAIAEFQLTANRFSAEWDEDEVEDAGDTTAELEIDHNRNEYTVHITADDLDGDEVYELFEDSQNTTTTLFETTEGAILHRINDDDFEADFDGVDPGDYDFEFDQVDSVAEDSDSISVVDGDDDDLVFVDDSPEAIQGDVAEIEIEDVAGAEEGTLIIGDLDDDGYEAVINITEIEDDTFTIDFNTYLAGNDSEEIVSSDDDVEVEIQEPDNVNQSDIDGILDTGDYDLHLGTDTDVVYDDRDAIEEFIDGADEVGTLFIEDRTVGDMELWTATTDNAEDLEDADDIEAAIDDGLLTQTDTVAFDDALVHQIELDGIGGFFAGVDEDDLDEQFLALATGDGEDVNGDDLEQVVDLQIEQTDESRQSNRQAKELNTSALSEDDIEVIYEGGELFLSINSVNDDDLSWDRGSSTDVDLSDEDEFTVDLEISDERLLEEGDDQDPYVQLTEDDDDEYLVIGDEDFTVEDRDGEFINLNDDDEIEVEAGEDQEITAETNIAPGSEVDIRTSGTDGARFVKTQRDLVVNTDGEIVGEFDFSDREVDETFEAQLRSAGIDDRPEEDGIIVESIEDAPEDDEDDVVDDEDDVVDDDDDVVDDDDDVVDDDDDVVDDDDDAVDDVDDETPGFGAIVALVALIGAALLAVRRQN